MRKIKDLLSSLFIASILFLTTVTLLGIWMENLEDLIEKSFLSFGLILFVTVIVVVASRYAHSNEELQVIEAGEDPGKEAQSIAMFSWIRKLTVYALIVCASLLAFLGLLSIWEIVTGSEVLEKVLASLGSLIFAAVLIIVTCVLRVKVQTFDSATDRKRTPAQAFGLFVGVCILMWVMFLIIEAF